MHGPGGEGRVLLPAVAEQREVGHGHQSHDEGSPAHREGPARAVALLLACAGTGVVLVGPGVAGEPNQQQRGWSKRLQSTHASHAFQSAVGGNSNYSMLLGSTPWWELALQRTVTHFLACYALHVGGKLIMDAKFCQINTANASTHSKTRMAHTPSTA